MTTHTASFARGRSRGFTLVELLVVIAIIGMLMALLVPAVSAARATARRNECSNRIKQLAIATVNYETSKQRYPGYVNTLSRGNNQYLRIGVNGLANSVLQNTTNPDASRVSWAALILPQLDRKDLYDALTSFEAAPGGALSAQSPIRPVNEYFACPSDTELTSLPDNAGMTYVANAGTWDWYNTSGAPLPAGSNFDRADYTAIPASGGLSDRRFNGVFHNRTLSNLKLTMTDLTDGASLTILYSENVHKEIDTADTSLYTWAGVDGEPDNASPGQQQLGMVWVDDAQLGAAEGPFVDPEGNYLTGGDPPQYPFSVEGGTQSFYEYRPTYARPASTHPQGSFNTAFADGRVKTLSADIDYSVYQRLMTPNGSKAVEPVLSRVSSYRNLPPLASTDLDQ